MFGAAELTAFSTFGELIGDFAANAALGMPGVRSIGDLYPHVVVQEVHSDELQITTHPIETGTPVTDHAFPLPCTVEIRCGWSNSTAATEGFVQAIYQQLLDLQASREPFAVVTGKRFYENMLARSVGVKTDEESEYVLMATVLAQQIVITDTTAGGDSSTPMSDGTSNIAKVGSSDGPTNPGEVEVQGGADPAPAASLTSGDTGAVVWTNEPALQGTPSLIAAPTAPSLGDLNVGITSDGQVSQ